jgi:hypothetical protein
MSSKLPSMSLLSRKEPEKRMVVHYAVSVQNDKFYLRLKTSKEKYPIVSGFDTDADGLPGELQAGGQVGVGDYLKSLNGISMYNRPFRQCVTIIRRESQLESPKELAFFRFEAAPPVEDDSSWQTKSPVYSTYSTQILSALRDRTDLDMTTSREFSKLVSR